MKVLLTSTVKGLGISGQVVEVTDAYARNFLIPQRRAIVATPDVIKHQAEKAASAARHTAAQQAKIDDLIKHVAGTSINITGQASPGGKLFAAIKVEAMRQAIQQQTGASLVDGRWSPDHVKTVGDHTITISWLAGQQLSFTLHVTAAE